jgi:hypothetical protein
VYSFRGIGAPIEAGILCCLVPGTVAYIWRRRVVKSRQLAEGPAA